MYDFQEVKFNNFLKGKGVIGSETEEGTTFLFHYNFLIIIATKRKRSRKTLSYRYISGVFFGIFLLGDGYFDVLLGFFCFGFLEAIGCCQIM